MLHIIYKTTNKVNNKIYIGAHSTTCLDDGYLGSGTHLRRAIKHYGREMFCCQVLCSVDSREDMFELEELVVDEEFVARSDTYNLKVGGLGNRDGDLHPMFGRHHSPESRSKISDTQKLNGHPRGMLGKTHSAETKEKIRSYHKGKTLSGETKEKIRCANLGKTMSEESRLKMSEIKKETYQGENHPMFGREHSEESKEKMRQGNLGKKMSEETKKKISLCNTGSNNPNFSGYWHTPAGIFDSCIVAGEANGVSRKTVSNRCRSTELIQKPLILKGLTWKELGWWFEPKKEEDSQQASS